MKPQTLSKNSIKIDTENKLIEDPLDLAEEFNTFFKEKVEKLAARIKRDPNNDPFLRLRKKLQHLDLNFNLRTVHEKEVLKILKSLKSKKSCGLDGITSEVLKVGAEVLVVPLKYIINAFILTGKYPTNWKVSKIVPLFKKGDRK